jgi:hypothetical protein
MEAIHPAVSVAVGVEPFLLLKILVEWFEVFIVERRLLHMAIARLAVAAGHRPNTVYVAITHARTAPSRRLP